jgi:hypothetical protein
MTTDQFPLVCNYCRRPGPWRRGGALVIRRMTEKE